MTHATLGRTNSFSSGAPLNPGRAGHAALLRPDGRVLFVGGSDPTVFVSRPVYDTIELFDPVRLTFTPAGKLLKPRSPRYVYTIPRGPHAGKILIGGGGFFDFELYDPATETSTTTDLVLPMENASAVSTEYGDGKVLLSGGSQPGGFDYVASALILNLVDLSLTPTKGQMALPRGSHGAVLQGDGKIPLYGGSYTETNRRQRHTTTEIFDPLTEIFNPGPEYTPKSLAPSVVPLPDDSILFMGGAAADGTSGHVDVYHPSTGFSVHPKTLDSLRSLFSATLLNDGRVMLLGGQIPLPRNNSALVSRPEFFVP